jgi:hypothetical protein
LGYWEIKPSAMLYRTDGYRGTDAPTDLHGQPIQGKW